MSREGCLTEEQRDLFQEKVKDCIDEANDAFEEIYGNFPAVELMEVCCPVDSRLVETFLSKGRQAIRIGLPAFDLSKRSGKEELMRMVDKHRPKLLWFSLPCGPYSPIQTVFNEDTPEKLRKVKRERQSLVT